MSDQTTELRRQRVHKLKEVIFTLTTGIDEISKGYRFDDKFGPHKIKQLVSARDSAVEELKEILKKIESA